MKPCPFCGADAVIAQCTRNHTKKAQGEQSNVLRGIEYIARAECIACRAATDWLTGRDHDEAGRMAEARWDKRPLTIGDVMGLSDGQ